tara:strand:- start:1159 stop:1434 length:276 start_codon:yes stop_codon:yes gene_type:complete
MEHIQKAIKSFLKNTGLENGVAQQKAIEVWCEIVGEKVAKNTNAESIEHGTLTVKTKNPVWRQELLFQKKEIIKKLNKKLKKNIIKEIRFL